MAADELIGYIEKGEIINSVNMPRMALPELCGKRVCVIHRAGAADAVRAALGAEAKCAVRGAYGYTVADCDADAGEIAKIDGVIRVRVLG